MRLETKVDALDRLAQLSDELIFDYSAGGASITTIVTELLALQVSANPIGVGTIEPVVTRSIEVQQDTILGALQKLRDTVGGYISVNNDGDLDWFDDIGEDKGQQIRYRKNVKGLTRTLEYSNFGNRLYCYVEGEGTARLHLDLAPGMTEDYVEDIPSQTANGICIRQLTDKSITDPTVLLAWANLKLAEMKDPRVSYEVDMVYLGDLGWDFEELQLGSIVKVIDEDLGIDVEARIVKISHDISNPANIVVEISNVIKNIVDLTTGVYDTQQFQDHIATKIGAGQVVVLGAFTVSDWVTGGTTNIKGDYIRTGIIQSNNWGAFAGSYFNLNDGVFMLGGSTSPKLTWDGATLYVDGYIQVGNAIPPGGAAADVNANVTTITGGKIKTGNLESTNWGAAAGSQFNLDNGTFKLGGSSAPKLSWNGTTLSITGYIAVGGGAADVNAGTTKISGGKIVAGSLTVTSAEIVSLAATKITGQIIDAQILTVDFAKITSVSITSAQIVSLAATKITGQIVNAQILTVDFAKITSVTITDAQITSVSATKLTAGNLSVTATLTAGGILKSTNYITGVSGWQIDHTGNAEFNTVKVRGTINNSTIASGQNVTVSGTITAGGGAVVIGPTGINIFGLGNALTTRATVGGTIQCYVGADGKFYAGGGNVALGAGGIWIDSVASTSNLTFSYSGVAKAYIYCGYTGALSMSGASGIHLYSNLYSFYDIILASNKAVNWDGAGSIIIPYNAGVAISGSIVWTVTGVDPHLWIYTYGAFRQVT